MQALYIDGTIAVADYRTRMQRLNYGEQAINDAIDVGNAKINSALTKQYLAKTKKDYVAGLIGDVRAQNIIGARVLTDTVQQLIFNDWTAEKNEQEQASLGKALDEVKKERLAIIKKGFLSGHIFQPQATYLLSVDGYGQALIDEYIHAWQLENVLTVKLPTKLEAIRQAKEGIISVGQMSAYLMLENESADAVGEITAEVLLHLAQVQANEQAKQTKQVAQTIKITQAQQDKLSKELSRQAGIQQKRDRYLAMVNYNLNRAYKLADLTDQLATIKSAGDKATAKSGVSRMLASGKALVEKQHPLPI